MASRARCTRCADRRGFHEDTKGTESQLSVPFVLLLISGSWSESNHSGVAYILSCERQDVLHET